jgi:hypothetical protein
MKERFRKELERVSISPLGNEAAAALRLICTHLGLATHCPANACKRARACATRQVLCWQIRRYEINQLIQRILAHEWQRRVANGENVDIAPARVRTYVQILAREKLERASAAGGTDDVSDTVASWSKGE